MSEFKRMLIMTGYNNDWLYSQMMPVLRARYGTSFYIVAAPDRVAEFRAKCAPEDTVVSIDFPGLDRHVGEVEPLELSGCWKKTSGFAPLYTCRSALPTESTRSAGSSNVA